MKTLFFKNRMPVFVAILAITGAFATTSMQSISSTYQLKTGYALLPTGECGIAVLCSDTPSAAICRVSYPSGFPAFGIDPVFSTCTVMLYRPNI